MLAILLFLLAEYALFQYVITPQLSQLSNIKTEIAGWEAKQQDLVVIKDTISQLDQEKSDLDADINNIGNDYFASLDEQEEAIIVLNDLLQDSGLTDIYMSFEPLEDVDLNTNTGNNTGDNSAVQTAEIAAPLVQRASVEFEGTYDAVWKALRSFWNFGKFIKIDSLKLDQGKENLGILSGSFTLSLYDLSPMTDAPGNMVLWAENGTYRKANPFELITGEPFYGTRYILNVNNEDLKKYERFTDISGNWAETAIDDFGKQHLIMGDNENRYFPDQAMSRGELVILLDQFFQWESPTDAVDLTQFSDYNELGQSLSAMEKAFFRGYIRGCFVGYDDGTLRPNAPASYIEFELVMQKCLSQPDFNWKDAAQKIEQETGFKSSGIDNESAAITRAEVVYFLHALPRP